MERAALRQDDVVTAGRARELGIPRYQLGRTYRRVGHGLYVPDGVALDDVDARLAIVAHGMPPGMALGGWAAARLHEGIAAPPGDEIRVFDGFLPASDASGRAALPVLVCADRRRRIRAVAGARLFRSDLRPDEIRHLDGVPVTSALRTAFDLARLWPTSPAVVALDRLRRLGLLDPVALSEVLEARGGWRGVGRARTSLELSSDGVESPRETMMRLLWVRTGLPQPVANPTLVDGTGMFLARVDLLDPTVGLVAEYDGAHHATSARRARDAARQERLEHAGLVVVRANEPDIAEPAARHLWQQRLRLAHRRASAFDRRQTWSVRG